MSPSNEAGFEQTDTSEAQLGFGKGGVPWYLMLFYLSFLVFFAWYVLEYQLPDYLEQGPMAPQDGAVEAPETPK